ncbi:MAG: ftsH [Chlamydiales bacterium]|jgi:cell division protease FtsH|nr:ftsH [Chlamydiales bacterium]
MNDEKKQDPKKGIQNNILLMLMALLSLMFLVRAFADTKNAKVSFSYQVEHLVNLNLIEPEESRKTAITSNLVTFSGQFKDQLTDEGKARFKYLSLLSQTYLLNAQIQQVADDLRVLKGKVRESADWFLKVTGMPIPQGGFQVIDSSYDVPERINHITIYKTSEDAEYTLADVNAKMKALGDDIAPSLSDELYKSISYLVRSFRSPILGIGKEPIKKQLRDFERKMEESLSSSDIPAKMALYRQVVDGLNLIAADLSKELDHVKMDAVRSMRSYRESIAEYNDLLAKREETRVQLERARQAVLPTVWFFNDRPVSTRQLEKQDPEQFQQWFMQAQKEWDAFAENAGGYFKAPSEPLNTVLERTFKSEELPPNYLSYLVTMAPVLLVLLLIYFVFSRQMKGVGGAAMNFGKSPAKLLQKGQNKVTFKDVAGIDEALEELKEIVDFLKDPQRFTALGGHIPKGVLCIGPPGTGKTLVAKAVAGEADRPFFSISGSDFVEMFVGVGASRIRDMFDQAKKHAPCIIFMDEIDAVGRQRGAGMGGGHDEREQTLNQLLVEMDGFDSNEGVILMAATNRPDVLDKALLRPGRFDRRVIIDLPDIKGRFEILKVHARKVKLDETVDLMAIARSTPGCSGADLMNILNESALIAARKGKRFISSDETMEARDKVLYGKERRSLEIDETEKRTTAYHEAGHAVVSLTVKTHDPLEKVTIIPRGMSLGATMYLPTKNRVSYWRHEVIDRLAVLMGGRSAEEIFLGDICSGASHDIQQATRLARSMVCEWGMNEKLGTVAYDERSSAGQYLGGQNYHEKLYSEATAQSIDEEVRKLVEAGHQRALEILQEKKEQVQLITDLLVVFETLDSDQIRKVFSGEWTSIEDMRKTIELKEQTIENPPPPPIDHIVDQVATKPVTP